jgi:hypothetical protein
MPDAKGRVFYGFPLFLMSGRPFGCIGLQLIAPILVQPVQASGSNLEIDEEKLS